MTTIDQRILIPAPPDVVWAYVSNIENYPKWQVACETITFLSQKRQGVGTRWRERTASRQEHVFEVTSWYDGLGYEYVFIDGGNFQSSTGRVRVQEIPEGTIVQWTFTYELGGVLSGLRNALTTQRRIEGDMVESLKTLWKLSRRSGSLDGYQSRALMQDGLQDPEERAKYQPRHVSKVAQTSEQPSVPIVEPPVSEEDTRPRASLAQDTTAEPSSADTSEADEIAGVGDDDIRYAAPSTEEHKAPEPPAPPPEITDTMAEDHWRYAPPPEQEASPPEEPSVSYQAEPLSPQVEESAASTPPEQPDAPTAGEQAVPSTPPPEDPAVSASPELSEPLTDDERATPSTPPPEEPAISAPYESLPSVQTQEPPAAENEDDLEPQVSPGTDTSEMSIWEVFGIPSPTDTQKMRAIQAAEEAEREYEAEEAAAAAQDDEPTVPHRPPVASEPTAGREGLRTSKRRGLIRVRRPGK